MKTDLVIGGYIFNNNKLLLILHRKSSTWLPVGGHIEENETPDEALKREVKEEVNLNIEILGESDIPVCGSTKKNLAIPFYVNVHNVGDHDHSCFFYICRAKNPKDLKINKELTDFGWFSRDGLNDKKIPDDVRSIGLAAFEIYEKLI